MTRLPALVLALAATAACAQGGATTSPVGPEDVPSVAREDGSASDLSRAERAVLERVQTEGVHVVLLWAPWCGNSRAALETGWYEVIERYAEVSFTFVTVRNGGADGAAALRRYGIPASATVLAHPDPGPGAETTFLGRPVTWTPTTWIFNRGGRLAYAFNYGEVSAERLETAIQDAQATWEHD